MMWIRVYGGLDMEIAEVIFASLKQNFPHIPITMSAIDGKLIKINMEGESDERPLSAHANAIESFWKKTYKNYKNLNENALPSA